MALSDWTRAARSAGAINPVGPAARVAGLPLRSPAVLIRHRAQAGSHRLGCSALVPLKAWRAPGTREAPRGVASPLLAPPVENEVRGSRVPGRRLSTASSNGVFQPSDVGAAGVRMMTCPVHHPETSLWPSSPRHRPLLSGEARPDEGLPLHVLPALA